ncbi:hypothetical protein PUN4_1120045 [Paraburkholderia unamae]|nr:hypothetical protein PUN4_1120045 [Paraburkholderia unamae]
MIVAAQKADPELKGMRWTLLKDANKLNLAQLTDFEALLRQYTTKRTARAWLYCEQLREILERKQIHVVSESLRQWCTNVMRSKVEPMKEVARLIRRHFDGIVAWTQTRQTNGFIEAINGLFQAAKRAARGYTRFATMRTVLFLSLANSTSLHSTRMPAESRYPLHFQKSPFSGRAPKYHPLSVLRRRSDTPEVLGEKSQGTVSTYKDLCRAFLQSFGWRR